MTVAVVPENLEQAAGMLSGAAARGDAVTFRGGGTELGFGYPAERSDLELDTRRLCRVVDYAPSDMIVEVEAGCTLAALQAVLEPNRQRLALDPPSAATATLGGLLATNAFGPRRARFGTLRDLIVGISLVRADGERVRGGGKVVKNVAGFDLPKLAVGSLGSLGMIATATFRLHPMPQTASLSRISGCDGAALRALVRAMTARQLEPAATIAAGANRGSAAYDAYVLFEGFESGVAEQRDRLESIARDLALPGPIACDPNDLASIDGETRCYGDLRLRLAAPPALFERLERDAVAPLRDAFPDLRSVLYPSLGVVFVSMRSEDAALERIQASRARAVAEALGGNLVVLTAPSAVTSELDVYGTLPESFPLMRALKARFDPDSRLNRGRFAGRL